MVWSWGRLREWLALLRGRSRGTVLLVDTDARWRGEARRALQGAGYRVMDAATPVEALQRLAGRRVRVVVTDYPLRLPSGRPLAQVLHSNALPGLVIVALITESGAAHFKAAAADGCRGVVRRPAEPGVLVKLVNLMTSLPVLVLELPHAGRDGAARGRSRNEGTLPAPGRERRGVGWRW